MMHALADAGPGPHVAHSSVIDEPVPSWEARLLANVRVKTLRLGEASVTRGQVHGS